MPTEAGRSRLTVEELANRTRGELIPLSHIFSYFSTLPVAEEDLKQYLQEPIAALSPAICGTLPNIGILLVPYLEKGNGRAGDQVAFDKPAEARQLKHSRRTVGDTEILAFAIKDEEVAEYHYTFYTAISSLVTERLPEETEERFFRLIREELGAEVQGEIDERSWHLKQALLRRQANVKKETKLFRDYGRQAFEDTLTLYLHGTCCDIDVETGPRQMPSRYIRKRLELLLTLYPPPEGYAVLPEQLKGR